jgi:hypothetical protein
MPLDVRRPYARSKDAAVTRTLGRELVVSAITMREMVRPPLSNRYEGTMRLETSDPPRPAASCDRRARYLPTVTSRVEVRELSGPRNRQATRSPTEVTPELPQSGDELEPFQASVYVLERSCRLSRSLSRTGQTAVSQAA